MSPISQAPRSGHQSGAGVDLSVSLDRTGIVVEIEEMSYPRAYIKGRPMRMESATLSPDEARAIAVELNDAADLFERNDYQFASRRVGEPR